VGDCERRPAWWETAGSLRKRRRWPEGEVHGGGFRPRARGPSANTSEGNERRETVGASWFGARTMRVGF